MQNKRLLILVAALLLNPASGWAQKLTREDHLEPDDSILGGTETLADYGLQVRSLLDEAFGRHTVVRMIAIPSFSPEYAVGLREARAEGRGPPYHIFVLTPAASIWTYKTIDMFKTGQERAINKNGKDANQQEMARLQASVPADPKDLKISQCEANISDALGNRIIGVWQEMLLGTRYSRSSMMGLDGETDHFSMMSTIAGPMASKVWSPNRDSAGGTLVTLAYTMRQVCEKKATEAQIDQLTTELEQRLKKGEGK